MVCAMLLSICCVVTLSWTSYVAATGSACASHWLRKASKSTDSNGKMNRNRTRCILAVRSLFIMAILFLSEEKLNWLAILKWLFPITLSKRYWYCFLSIPCSSTWRSAMNSRFCRIDFFNNQANGLYQLKIQSNSPQMMSTLCFSFTCTNSCRMISSSSAVLCCCWLIKMESPKENGMIGAFTW